MVREKRTNLNPCLLQPQLCDGPVALQELAVLPSVLLFVLQSKLVPRVAKEDRQLLVDGHLGDIGQHDRRDKVVRLLLVRRT